MIEKIRRGIRNTLGFSRTEANGFIVLLPLMILMLSSRPLYKWLSNLHPKDYSAETRYLDSLLALSKTQVQSADTTTQTDPANVSGFAFDPNKVSADSLILLGFDERLSNRIVAYRSKGGVFLEKRDLLKIYGTDSSFYHQIESLIRIEKVIAKKQVNVQASTFSQKRAGIKIATPFDLNQCDSSALDNVAGVGPVLAQRILKFRKGLGGFVAKDQLKEVYGLDTAVMKRIQEACFIEHDFEPVRININTADEKILNAHPYVSRTIAKALVAYRFQHGAFHAVEDIRKLPVITPEIAEKLLKYLTVEQTHATNN